MQLREKVKLGNGNMVPVESGTGRRRMLGVVVWSNEARSKAVIWCEDQGALAYLEGAASLLSPTGWPCAGDLIELDCIVEAGLRLARNVRLLSPGAGAALPHALRARAAQASEDPPIERVVPQRDLSHLRLVTGCEKPDCPANAATSPRTAAAR